jgi:hypothetical protein
MFLGQKVPKVLYEISNHNAVFGVELSSLIKPGEIPDIVSQSVKYIDQKALDVVGIFRLSGSSIRIDEYKQAFDKGNLLANRSV